MSSSAQFSDKLYIYKKRKKKKRRKKRREKQRKQRKIKDREKTARKTPLEVPTELCFQGQKKLLIFIYSHMSKIQLRTTQIMREETHFMECPFQLAARDPLYAGSEM